MKQTKPFGKPSSVEQLSLPFPPPAKLKKASEIENPNVNIRKSTEVTSPIQKIEESKHIDSSTDNFVSKTKVLKRTAVRIASILACVALCLTGMLMIRDSYRVYKNIGGGSSEESVMHCVAGYIDYPNNSVIDMIAGNGVFVCSHWKTEKRFMSLPRGFNFVD